MKYLLTCLALIGFAFFSGAQQKEGKVTYERKSQMSFSINNGDGPSQPIQQTRTDRFELNFADNKMIWEQLPEDIQEDASNSMNGGGGGGQFVFRTIGGGGDNKVFCDFSAARKVQSMDLFDKKFIISDSIRKGNWKLSDETRTILGFPCRKATSQRIGTRMMMQMENGKMERKEITDTTEIVAWFTLSIPVPAGPEMQGQLPGLILSLETNNGRTVYEAVDISDKVNKAAIKEPTKGKKVTQEQYNQERNKMLEEMQQNGGGSFRIRAG